MSAIRICENEVQRECEELNSIYMNAIVLVHLSLGPTLLLKMSLVLKPEDRFEPCHGNCFLLFKNE